MNQSLPDHGHGDPVAESIFGTSGVWDWEMDIVARPRTATVSASITITRDGERVALGKFESALIHDGGEITTYWRASEGSPQILVVRAAPTVSFARVVLGDDAFSIGLTALSRFQGVQIGVLMLSDQRRPSRVEYRAHGDPALRQHQVRTLPAAS